MRAFARASFLAASVSLLVLGCGSDDPIGPVGLNGSMSAVVDGVPWMAMTVTAGRSTGDVIGMGGTANDQTVISMAFTASGPGTYSIPQVGMNFNYSVLPTGALWQALGIGDLGAVGSGSVTVTTLTEDRVAGTFQFQAPAAGTSSATGEKVVTEGVFDIPLAND